MGVDRKGFPTRNPAIVSNDDAEAPSLLNPLDGEVFVTNQVGHMVMELADGSRSLDAIVEAVLGRFHGASEETVKKDVESFLELGTEKGLIEWSEAT